MHIIHVSYDFCSNICLLININEIILNNCKKKSIYKTFICNSNSIQFGKMLSKKFYN